MLKVRDGSLDRYLRAYCEQHGIICDGDIFGVMFSGASEFTFAQAEILIDMAADLYHLHMEAAVVFVPADAGWPKNWPEESVEEQFFNAPQSLTWPDTPLQERMQSGGMGIFEDYGGMDSGIDTTPRKGDKV